MVPENLILGSSAGTKDKVTNVGLDWIKFTRVPLSYGLYYGRVVEGIFGM